MKASLLWRSDATLVDGTSDYTYVPDGVAPSAIGFVEVAREQGGKRGLATKTLGAPTRAMLRSIACLGPEVASTAIGFVLAASPTSSQLLASPLGAASGVLAIAS